MPKGHIWIEGDNKHNSRDSRQFGPVPYGLLEGRVFWVVREFNLNRLFNGIVSICFFGILKECIIDWSYL